MSVSNFIWASPRITNFLSCFLFSFIIVNSGSGGIWGEGGCPGSFTTLNLIQGKWLRHRHMSGYHAGKVLNTNVLGIGSGQLKKRKKNNSNHKENLENVVYEVLQGRLRFNFNIIISCSLVLFLFGSGFYLEIKKI